MKTQLEDAFTRKQVQVLGREIPGGTGYFEVELCKSETDCKLLHSKRNGQGFVDIQAKLDKIVQDIGQELNNQESNKMPKK